MASNFKSKSLGNGYTLQAYFNQGNPNVANNYSPIYVEAKLSATNTNWSSSYASKLKVYWHDNRENYDREVASIDMYGCSPWTDYYASGTINVTHNNDGNLSGYAYAKFEKGGTSSYAPNSGDISTDWTALDKINRVARTDSVTTQNSDVEGDFSVSYTKYVNNYTYKLRISLPNIVELQKIDYNTSGTTFQLSEFTKNILFTDSRSTMKTTNEVKLGFAVETWDGGTQLSDGNEKIITVKLYNSNPIFTNFEYEETNNTIKTLTGSTTNNVINVNGYSNIRATISTTNKATSQKGADMVKYRFAIGDKSTDITYSDSASVNGTITGATNGTYNVYAIDTRNNSTLVTKQATRVIDYSTVSINKQTSSIQRDNNQVGENTILTLNGTFWNGNFGATSNAIQSVTYRFKKTNSSTWITGTTTITPTINGNSFSFEDYIASDNLDTTWDLDASYNIEVTVNDKLTSSTAEFILNSAIPTLSLDKNGVGVMCGYNSDLGGLLQVGGKIIDGGTILWTNTSPTSEFSSQNITLSSSDYDELLIICKHWNDSTLLLNQYTTKGNGSLFITVTGGTIYRRDINYTDDTTYSVGNCTNSSGNNSNGTLIPLYVIGYKTNLFN